MGKYKAKTHEPDSMETVQSNIATALFAIANAIEKQTEMMDVWMNELTDGTSELIHIETISEQIEELSEKLGNLGNAINKL